MTSWAIEAIEREAMRRAQRDLERPHVFYWMGVSQDRLTWLIMDYQRRTGKRADQLDPNKPHIAPLAGEGWSNV